MLCSTEGMCRGSSAVLRSKFNRSSMFIMPLLQILLKSVLGVAMPVRVQTNLRPNLDTMPPPSSSLVLALAAVVGLCLVAQGTAVGQQDSSLWMWRSHDPSEAAPENVFTYFRTVFTPTATTAPVMRFAAVSLRLCMCVATQQSLLMINVLCCVCAVLCCGRLMQDSNGAVYLNGQPLRLKMTRFTESHNKAEVITGTTIRTHSQSHTNHPSPN